MESGGIMDLEEGGGGIGAFEWVGECKMWKCEMGHHFCVLYRELEREKGEFVKVLCYHYSDYVDEESYSDSNSN